jgi:ATP-dependent DNA helicase RecQ
VAEAELHDIPGVGASREEMLRENCYNSVEDIANAKSTKLASDTELNEQIAEDIHRGAKFLQGHPDSVLAKLASDYDIAEQEILRVYKRIVIYGGSFTEKKTALRMYFSDEQTIFNMPDISLHHLYLLYRNGFEDVESVAASTTDALTEVPFITYQAEEIINKAREMANIKEESKEENKIDKTSENKETKSTDECICPDCGKEFKFERVYKKHQYSCDGTRTVTSESSGSKSPSTNDRSTSSKIEPCPLTEYYEAFRSLRATLKKLNPKVDNDDKIDLQTKYYKMIDSIITQGHPHNEEIEGYGSQQADRAPHKTDEYRDEFGNGRWITAYPAINSVGPEPACVDQFQSSLSEMELHISRPIPPGEETAIPIVIKSESELSEALWLLSQLPAKPALSPDEEHGSNSLPIEDIYEAKFEETNIETVGIQPPENKTVREAETNVEDDWEGEKIAAALGLNWAEIQNTITNLKSKGCSHSEAIQLYQQYLRELIRGEGLFALSGVGPIEALELREYGIKSVEDLQAVTADSVAANTELDTEEIRSYKSAAKKGLYDSIDPNFPDVAEQLLEDSVGHGEGVTNEIDTDESDRTQAEATRELLVTQSQAEKLLQQCVGQNADFRPQQWQAIDSLVNEKEQLLLVQRTGWGKSTVYFIATHVLRKHGAGPTLIISPLLSLMRDQMKNAEKELGLSATTINSENEEDWDKIYNKIVKNEYDLVLISPERLENQEFREEVLSEMADGFGMFVVDEAHCISDWGHDFRPDYQRVTRILELLPSNVPVAATTATANDRVVDDITTQLPGLQPIRGNLVRESLQIQAINMGRRQRRLAWLAENLPDGQRAGIVYCLTTSDVTRVTEWLQKHGYDVESYHGSIDDETRRQREQLLLENEVDALVATIALGMGFDKPDLKYVIHFQRPPDLIRYYQEIGRAGRDLNQAHAVVLSGPDDDDTAEYFIESAFPSANNFDATLAAITEAQNPLTKWDIRKKSDGSNVERCLKILQVEGVIKRTDEGFVRTANEWEYPADKYEKITRQRYEELKCIQEFMETDRCLTLFIDEELDGKMTEPCGRCANCAGDLYPRTIENEALVEKAVKHFQRSGIETISNRVYRYADDGTRQKIPEEHQLETGRCLSVYDEPGWGTAVRRGKYETGRFNDSLVNGAAELIKERWDPSPKPEWVTFVPSTSEEGLIANFARRLADELDLEAIECVYKSEETKPQKGLSGSFEKCANVRNAFSATEAVRSDPVLLVDDIVSSRWTLTEVGLQLSQAGSEQVYPFALARRRG